MYMEEKMTLGIFFGIMLYSLVLILVMRPLETSDITCPEKIEEEVIESPAEIES